MINRFASRIRDIEAKINRAKTLGMSSASSLAVIEKTFTASLQIVPTRVVSGEVLDCGSSQFFRINIATDGGAPALIGLRLLSPINFTELILVNRVNGDNNVQKYGYTIRTEGGQHELDILNNGGTLPVVNYKFKIVATSNFTFTTQYTDRPS